MIIHGLVRAAQYNGRAGRVLHERPTATGRWRVSIDESPNTKPLAVKPANLRPRSDPDGWLDPWRASPARLRLLLLCFVRAHRRLPAAATRLVRRCMLPPPFDPDWISFEQVCADGCNYPSF